MDQTENFLKRKVLLNSLTGEDADCIWLFITDSAAIPDSSGGRRHAIAQILVSTRRYLKIPFRQMTTRDLYTVIDRILHDTDLDEQTTAESIRYLKEFLLWLKKRDLAAPGLMTEKVLDITVPDQPPDPVPATPLDYSTDSIPPGSRHKIRGAGSRTNPSDISFFITLAEIFLKSGNYDLAEMVAEYVMNYPEYQNACLFILMRAAYAQKDLTRSLGYVTSLLENEPGNNRYLSYKQQILDASPPVIPGTDLRRWTIEAYYFTHQGGIRTRNEDSLLIGKTMVTSTSMERPDTTRMDTGDTILCVADGIGGQAKGEVAGMMTLTGIRDLQDYITDETTLAATLNQVKRTLDDYAITHPDASHLGCTLAGICLREGTAIAFNVGDCRVYRIHEGQFERITRDHSLVQGLFETGVIQEEEMQYHPRRNIVTSSISGDGSPDSITLFSIEVHLQEDEQFFICSDGIWECFSQNELELIYRKFQGYSYSERLLTAALARQASDNISAILVHIRSNENSSG